MSLGRAIIWMEPTAKSSCSRLRLMPLLRYRDGEESCGYGNFVLTRKQTALLTFPQVTQKFSVMILRFITEDSFDMYKEYRQRDKAVRCTPMRYIPKRCTPLRCTPVRHTPMRYTPMRCTPVRYTP
jgi:hypothetical protein